MRSLFYEEITIAIDGPAAGKSTVAKLVAYQLDYNYRYRCNVSSINLKALNNNIDVNDEDSLSNLLDNTTIEFHETMLFY